MRRIIRRVFIAVFLIAALIFGGLSIKLVLDYRKAGSVYDDFAEDYTSVASPLTLAPVESESPAEPVQPVYDEYAPISVDFESLLKDSPDCRGWLYCEGTSINYPVMQGEDNYTYLHALANKTYSFAGSLFLDYRAAADFSDMRSVIYGHNMLDESMFGSLRNYKDPQYAREHSKLYLLTPSQNYRLELIAGIEIPSNSPMYLNTESREELEEFITEARRESLLPAMYEGSTYDRVCCLSTCSYTFEEARLFIVCGMVPIG